MSRNISFFDIAKTYRRHQPTIERNIAEIFGTGDFGNLTATTARFERKIAAYTGARWAIGINNASDGLTMIQVAAGLRPCDEIIVPAMTFCSSASSCIHAGTRPVFADIDETTYALDPDSVRRTITRRTRAIMPVHLFHQPADLRALRALADDHGVALLEDSAESIGMWCGDRHTGLWGKAGVLSFFPTKTLGGFGDGGMILTDDAEVAETCLELRDHGRRTGSAVVVRPGYGSRLDSIQAAILLARLESLDDEIRRRQDLADLYTQRLGPLTPVVSTPSIPARDYRFNGVWYVYVAQVERRDELAAFLARRGVGTETYYPMPLHLQPAFSALGYGRGDFPVAERVCSRTLALPLYPDLSNDEAEYVCEQIFAFYEGETQ